MYGEKRVLKPPGSLMDNYHQVCKVHDATKMLFRPEWSDPYNIPHFLHCTNPDGSQFRTDDEGFKQTFDAYETPHLIHYYAKSVEEFIIKLEQSIPPYFRYLPDAYDNVKACPNNFTITYSESYEDTVRHLLSKLAQASAQDDGGKALAPIPEYQVGKLDHYDIYTFFKLRVAKRDEWDEDAYLRLHPDVAKEVQTKNWVDGLQHFMNSGFEGGRKSCWVRDEGTSPVRHCIGKARRRVRS